MLLNLDAVERTLVLSILRYIKIKVADSRFFVCDEHVDHLQGKMQTVHSSSNIPAMLISLPAVVTISRRLILDFNLQSLTNTMQSMGPHGSFFRSRRWNKQRLGSVGGKGRGGHSRWRLDGSTLVQFKFLRVWFSVLSPYTSDSFVILHEERPQCRDCTTDHANTELHPTGFESVNFLWSL